MRIRKTIKAAQDATMQQVVVPRLIKAAELAAREAAQAEAERVAREQAASERFTRPVVRTPRNAVEARDIFNSLFNEAA